MIVVKYTLLLVNYDKDFVPLMLSVIIAIILTECFDLTTLYDLELEEFWLYMWSYLLLIYFAFMVKLLSNYTFLHSIKVNVY